MYLTKENRIKQNKTFEQSDISDPMIYFPIFDIENVSFRFYILSRLVGGNVKGWVIDEGFAVYFPIVVDSQKEKDVRSSLKAEVERWA